MQMKSINATLSPSPLPFSCSCFHFSTSRKPQHHTKFPYNSFPSQKRRRARPKRLTPPNNPSPFTDSNSNGNNKDTPFTENTTSYGVENYRLVLDIRRLSSTLPPISKYADRFIDSATDSFNDLRTLITVDEGNRVVVSCKRSSVEFTGAVLVCGFVLVSAVRVLVRVLGWVRLGILSGGKGRGGGVVVRRDRSLGGREVVVAIDSGSGGVGGGGGEKKGFSRVLDNPLSLGSGFGGLEMDDYWRKYGVLRSGQRLPKWWPTQSGRGLDFSVLDRDAYQTEANRLVRAITDYRTSGKDVMEHDIIQLRRLCRTSGVQVSFDTENTRDAFYRRSTDFVLNVCSSVPSYSTSGEIDGENAPEFIAGLAENIGLENKRAARMVSAAVAARTRSCFLQTWALEVQGRHSEAGLELSKICLILRTFPPEESSPEMEMVARGLGKNLKVEQRELLLKMFVGVCGKESHRSAAEALGLMFAPDSVADQQESSHT